MWHLSEVILVTSSHYKMNYNFFFFFNFLHFLHGLCSVLHWPSSKVQFTELHFHLWTTCLSGRTPYFCNSQRIPNCVFSFLTFSAVFSHTHIHTQWQSCCLPMRQAEMLRHTFSRHLYIPHSATGPWTCTASLSQMTQASTISSPNEENPLSYNAQVRLFPGAVKSFSTRGASFMLCISIMTFIKSLCTG